MIRKKKKIKKNRHQPKAKVKAKKIQKKQRCQKNRKFKKKLIGSKMTEKLCFKMRKIYFFQKDFLILLQAWNCFDLLIIIHSL